MINFTLTLNDAFRDAFYKYNNNTALIYQDEKITYEQLRIRSNRVAHALMGIDRKENIKVASLMSNRLEYVYCQMAVFQSGSTLVPLNNMLGENEIKYILKDSKVKVLFVEERFFETVLHIREDLPELTTIVGLPDNKVLPDSFISWEDFQGSQSEDDITITIPPHHISLCIYTGGTTGNPKGVMHSYQTALVTLLAVMLENEIMSDEKILLTSPLPHAAGLSLQAGLLKGAEIYIEKKFGEEIVLNHIKNNKITYIMVVPTMLYRIIDFMVGKDFDVSSLRTIVYGTAPIARERLKQAIAIFGPVFIQTYGLTETPGAATKLTKNDHIVGEENIQRLTSCGRPSFLSRLKVVDDEGVEVPRGLEGEIIVDSPVNMIGYHDLPETTNKTLKDGWLYTGDIGFMDEDSYVYILDRKNDMIISGGMNVYSSEVEDVIQKHPGVRQVAVIGIPDADWGEAVTAFIIAQDPGLSNYELNGWSDENLSKYKRPKKYEFVESLPLTPYGKVDKKTLRQPFWVKAGRRV